MGDLARQSGGADGGRIGSGGGKANGQAGATGATGKPVIIEAAILQRVLEAHVRQHLDALAELRVNLG